jgi:3-oxoadipate enol-lactonase
MDVQTTFIGSAPRIAVDHAGAGPLALLLHGVGGNRSNWRDQLPVFAQHFQAVAWDARGYGDSDDYDGPLDMADFSADLLRVIDHFRAPRAHLIGLSMGGMIAMDFYQRHPDQVASLVLCDTGPGLRRTMSDAGVEEFLRLRKAPLLAGRQPAEFAPVVARSLVSPAARAGALDQLVASLSRLHPQSYLKALECVTRYDGIGDLRGYRVPALVVVGADDTLTPPSVSERMAAEIPGAELCVIDDAGHLSNIEQPEAFNRRVLDFLRAQAR